MDNPKDAPEYVAERNASLLAGFEAFMTFAAKYHAPPVRPEDVEISFHTCRTAVRALPLEMRLTSDTWLKSRGYESFL